MFQHPLPLEITRLSPEATDERIAAARSALGADLYILGHHYQRDEIIRWADATGDSFKLSRIAAVQKDPKYIIFCGVHFMAESADVLTDEDKVVILPNLSAGCSMADMANIRQVRDAWCDLAEVIDVDEVVPITYVNSSADLKAFVGEHGGACCTSSNARKVLEWALSKGKRVLFFPDQHLGRNTAVQMGFDPVQDMALFDPHKPMGGLDAEKTRASRFLLWRGHCSVHARFTVDQIAEARRLHPSVQVIVHPECSLDVVQTADQSGSTERIIQIVEGSPTGSVWAIGTEINLVSRLAKQHPDKTIFCLDPVICPCSTMYRIHPHYLLWVMENLVEGRIVNEIRVAPEIRRWARTALQRMLEIS